MKGIEIPKIVPFPNEEIREYGCCSQTCGGSPATIPFYELHQERETFKKLDRVR